MILSSIRFYIYRVKEDGYRIIPALRCHELNRFYLCNLSEKNNLTKRSEKKRDDTGFY